MKTKQVITLVALMLLSVLSSACVRALPKAPPPATDDTVCRVSLESGGPEFIVQFARQNCTVQYVELFNGSILWENETKKGLFAIIDFHDENKSVRIVTWEDGKAVNDNFYFPGQAVRVSHKTGEAPLMYYVGRKATDGSFMFVWTGEIIGYRQLVLDSRGDRQTFQQKYLLRAFYGRDCHNVYDFGYDYSVTPRLFDYKLPAIKFSLDDQWWTGIGDFHSTGLHTVGLIVGIDVHSAGVAMLWMSDLPENNKCLQR